MTTSTDHHWDELIELTHAVCDQRASEDDLRRLDQLLRADPDARWTYLRHVHLCADLRWKLGASAEANTLNRLKSFGVDTGGGGDQAESAGPTVAGAPLVESRDTPLPLLGGSWLDEWLEPLPKTWTPIQRLVALMLVTGVATFGLGALLALMIWPAMHNRGPGGGVGQPLAEMGVASIQAVSDDAAFSEASHSVLMPGFDQLVPGSRLRSGRLELESGTAELVFDIGARVELTAPCRFEPRTPGSGFLELGKIVAEVPPVATGFTVDAPGVKVVDLGTRFQMVVDKGGATDVQVDQGRVRLQRDGKSTELVAGQRVRVAADPSAEPLTPESETPSQPLAQDRPNLVNGSFEHASRSVVAGENRWDFRGWSHVTPSRPLVVRHQRSAPGPFVPAAEGEHCVQFIGQPRGEGAGLRQTIETVPDARYQLGFALNRAGSRSSVPTIVVGIYSDPAAADSDRPGDLAHRAIQLREQPGRWTRHSLEFTATGKTATIQFVEPVGTPSRDNAPLLDAVTIKRLDRSGGSDEGR